MNAILIEQAPEEARLAFEVHQNAAIERIRLARAKAMSKSVTEAASAPIAVTFTFKSKAIEAPDDILRLEVAFRMAGVEEPDDDAPGARRGQPEAKKPEPVVSLECAYEVDYALNAGFEITPEHVSAFKDGNAIFNAWPYFREYLQSSLQRMGLPPLTAPFLRLQPKPKPKARRPEKKELQAQRNPE